MYFRKVFPRKFSSEEKFAEAEFLEESSNMRKIKQGRDFSQFNSLEYFDKNPIHSLLI